MERPRVITRPLPRRIAKDAKATSMHPLTRGYYRTCYSEPFETLCGCLNQPYVKIVKAMPAHATFCAVAIKQPRETASYRNRNMSAITRLKPIAPKRSTSEKLVFPESIPAREPRFRPSKRYQDNSPLFTDA